MRRDAPLRVIDAKPIPEVDAPRTVLGESPRWANGRWWWLDAVIGTIWTRTAQGVVDEIVKDRGRVSLVLPAGRDRVVFAEGTTLRTAALTGDREWATREWTTIDLPTGWLLNDGTADRRGCLWVGSVAIDRPSGTGTLIRVQPDGSSTTVASGFTLSNGMAWDATGTVLYHADSGERVIWAHHIDGSSGAVLESSIHRRFDEADGMPDGLATDIDGGLWVAIYGQSEVRRYTRDATLDLIVDVPTAQVTSVELGGPDGRDLLITSAREGYDLSQSKADPIAGRVFAARSPHRGVRRFAVRVR